jgi:hypothetical protein
VFKGTGPDKHAARKYRTAAAGLHMSISVFEAVHRPDLVLKIVFKTILKVVFRVVFTIEGRCRGLDRSAKFELFTLHIFAVDTAIGGGYYSIVEFSIYMVILSRNYLPRLNFQ